MAEETDAVNMPRIEGEFDPERAQRLVAHLRGEVKELKEELTRVKQEAEKASGYKTQFEQAQEELSSVKNELTNMQQLSVKTKLLTDRGLGEDFIKLLTGDDEQGWTETADMLAALKGSSTTGDDTPPAGDDPVISAKNRGTVGEAVEIEQANRLFPN